MAKLEFSTVLWRDTLPQKSCGNMPKVKISKSSKRICSISIATVKHTL